MTFAIGIMLVLFTFLVVGSVALVINHHLNIYDAVIAGTTGYRPGVEHQLRFSGHINEHKHSNIVLVRAAEDGPEWKQGNILFVDVTGPVQKGCYYLFEQEGKYRIVQCQAANNGSLPDLFDGHETYITHNLVGQVIAVCEHLYKPEDIDYGISEPLRRN